jgi:methylthioribose-1-phosphate isomerase
VTPHRYIAAIFTERGVAKAPYTESLRTLSDAVPAKAAS